MAESVLSILLTLKDEASAGLDNLNAKLEDNKKTISDASKLLVAAGGAITGIVGYAIYAAESEKESDAKLATELKNVGTSYDMVKASLNSVIDAEMRKTGISDEDQRAALSQLLITTGDYNLSLKALPAVLDLAAAKGVDASSAALTLGKALEGDVSSLHRYGIEIPKTASAEDVLNTVTQKVGGTAEAVANPFNILKNSLHELAASAGATLIPALTSIVNTLTSVMKAIQGWINQHPVLVGVIMKVLAVIGPLLLGLGTLGLALPKITAGFKAIKDILDGTTIKLIAHTIATVASNIAMIAVKIATLAWTGAQWLLNAAMDANPIGLIILAIAGLVAIIILVVKHFDKVKDAFVAVWDKIKEGAEAIKNAFAKVGEFFKRIWDDIVKAFKGAINFIIGGFEGFINTIIKGLNLIPTAINKIAGVLHLPTLPLIPEISLPRLATGGIVTSPTIALLGERGPEAIVPLGSAGKQGEIHIHIGNFMGDQASLRAFGRVIKDVLNQDMRRTSFAGVNAGYFPGSSAP